MVHDTSQWNGKFHMDRDRHYTGKFSMKYLFISGTLYLASIPSRSNGMYAQKYITSIYISSQILLVSLDGLIHLQESKSGHAMILVLNQSPCCLRGGPVNSCKIFVGWRGKETGYSPVTSVFPAPHTMSLIYHRRYINWATESVVQ